MEENKLSHIDTAGNPAMVDVSAKAATRRVAKAQAIVQLGAEVMALLQGDDIHTHKGPVFQTAMLAGVMAAKKTADLIPLCHPLGLEDCQVRITVCGTAAVIDTETVVTSKTGVEMEALTAASVAALTVYDMCKAISHDIVIEQIKLMEKTGGKRPFKR